MVCSYNDILRLDIALTEKRHCDAKLSLLLSIMSCFLAVQVNSYSKISKVKQAVVLGYLPLA
jgi:hypothetical protein